MNLAFYTLVRLAYLWHEKEPLTFSLGEKCMDASIPRYPRVLRRLTTGTIVLVAGVTLLFSLGTTPAKGNQGQAIVNAAAKWAGTQYCWAGGNQNGPTRGTRDPYNGHLCAPGTVGFDCTGLTLYAVYQATGILLPHGLGQNSRPGGTPVARANLLPGDIVFFGPSLSNYTHAGIYAGGGKMWDAQDTGVPVQLHNLYSNYVGATRYGTRGGSSSPSISDGMFVRIPEGHVYRIVGGAPVHVQSCAPLGGCPGMVSIPNLSGFPANPRNGSFMRKADGEGAGAVSRVVGGHLVHLSTCAPFGGCAGMVNIDAGGYETYRSNHPSIASGTFVRVANGGKAGWVSRSVGGHLIHLATCAPLEGQCSGMVEVDEYGYDRYVETHNSIGNGALIRIANGGKAGWVSRSVGGHLIHLSTCTVVPGGCGSAVNVDEYGYDAYVQQHPRIANGSFIRIANGSKNGWISRVVGGHPVHLSTCAPFGGGCGMAVDVDEYGYDFYAQRNKRILNGTFVRIADGPSEGLITRAAGGVLFGLTSCQIVGGCPGTIDIDNYSWTNYVIGHRRPIDGTIVKADPHGAFWVFRHGKRWKTKPSFLAIGVDWRSLKHMPIGRKKCRAARCRKKTRHQTRLAPRNPSSPLFSQARVGKPTFVSQEFASNEIARRITGDSPSMIDRDFSKKGRWRNCGDVLDNNGITGAFDVTTKGMRCGPARHLTSKVKRRCSPTSRRCSIGSWSCRVSIQGDSTYGYVCRSGLRVLKFRRYSS